MTEYQSRRDRRGGTKAFPVRDGIPVMLLEEAKLPAGVESLAALKARLGKKE